MEDETIGLDPEAQGGALLTSRRLRRLLVPTDFSHSAERALIWAIELARLVGATLEVLHVHEGHPERSNAPLGGFGGSISVVVEVAAGVKERLDASAATVRASGIACEVSLLTGRAGEEIVARAAASGADLLVMGSFGRSGRRPSGIGRVAEHVAREAACPIFLVPEPALRDRDRATVA